MKSAWLKAWAPAKAHAKASAKALAWAQRCTRNARRVVAAFLAATALLGAGGLAAQTLAPDVQELRVERAEDGLYVSANLVLELPPAVEEALQKGIPIVFLFEADLLRERWYWTDRVVVHAARSSRLVFVPLTRRWRLTVGRNASGAGSGLSNSGLGFSLGQNFDSLAEALAAVSRLTRWKIAEPTELEADGRYLLDFQFKLDLSQLPRPFQIGAAGQSEWNLSASRKLRVVPEVLK